MSHSVRHAARAQLCIGCIGVSHAILTGLYAMNERAQRNGGRIISDRVEYCCECRLERVDE